MEFFRNDIKMPQFCVWNLTFKEKFPKQVCYKIIYNAFISIFHINFAFCKNLFFEFPIGIPKKAIFRNWIFNNAKENLLKFEHKIIKIFEKVKTLYNSFFTTLNPSAMVMKIKKSTFLIFHLNFKHIEKNFQEEL